MLALIDGDGLVYRCGFAGEDRYYHVLAGDTLLGSFRYMKEVIEMLDSVGLDREQVTIEKDITPQPLEYTLHSVKRTILGILDYLKTKECRIFIGGERNFRDDVAVSYPYKGNRENARRPDHYDKIREYLVDVWGAEVQDGIEADDRLGIEQTDETVICSLDKDLDMVPGWHFNWVKQEKYFVTEDMGRLRFYSQLLTGDPTDNIVGIHRMGSVRAAEVLADMSTEQEMFCEVGKQYAIHFDNPEERLLENGKLLWMMREEGKQWEFPA